MQKLLLRLYGVVVEYNILLAYMWMPIEGEVKEHGFTEHNMSLYFEYFSKSRWISLYVGNKSPGFSMPTGIVVRRSLPM